VLLFGTILLLGLVMIVPVALLGYPLTREIGFNGLTKTAFALVAGGTLMVLKYVFVFPLTCCADFRFQDAVIPWFGYCMARGLASFPRGNAMNLLVSIFLVSFSVAVIVLLVMNYSLR
jgi:hypothetical protein